MPLINRLTDLEIRKINKPCKVNDGDGLYLVAIKSKREGGGLLKRWYFRFRMSGYVSRTGKRADQWMMLGLLPGLSLKDAREKATDLRKQRDEGINPIIARRADHAARAAEQAKASTFREVVEDYIATKQSEWKNPKYAADWTSTLTRFVYPIIGPLAPSAIDTALVLKVLKPIWKTKTVTAGHVRERIEKILDAAKVNGLRDGQNPAQWRGHLEHKLSSVRKAHKIEHHAALHYSEVGEFMVRLRQRNAVSARALELLILCANRTNEVFGAEWNEFDLEKRVWTVPAERMKGGREHKIPLSDAAVKLVREMARQRRSDFVFPGDPDALSNSALVMVLRRMGVKTDDGRNATPHGFRATFKTWASEVSQFPSELVEVALAHKVGNATEQAYQRGELLEKRRKLMEAWSSYCAKQSAKVLPMVPRSQEASRRA